MEILLPRFFKSQEKTDQTIFLLAGVLAVILYNLLWGPKYREEGADRLRVPIRVIGRSHAAVRKMSQRRLARVLRTVPIYAELLDQNPHARITACP
jgi:hypothetical protein